MNCTAWNEKLHDHLDGTLVSADADALAAHVTTCPDCRAQLDSLRALRAATKTLPREIDPPRDLWSEIDLACRAAARRRAVFQFPSRTVLFKLAAVLAVLVTAAFLWKLRTPAPAWPVASLAGTPRVNAKLFQGESRLRVGQWLETDAASRAKLTVGAIGEVSVAPNSRVRLAAAAATDHRLDLARGELSALIWAPPRLFFVETPSATAVDLGCAYTLAVDDAGNGTLHVTAGLVALAHQGRETVITYGQKCSTRRGAGPGTPFQADAPAALQRALDRFDFAQETAALDDILSLARPTDAVTLCHLLTRTTAAARAVVFDTLARHHAPPAGVTRPGILSGDRAMLAQWADAIGVLGFAPR